MTGFFAQFVRGEVEEMGEGVAVIDKEVLLQ